MRTIKINRNRVTKRALEEAARVLRAGGVVAFPTETSYGLAADPAAAAAVRRVYVIKGRPARKPLPLVAASVAAVARTFRVDGLAAKLARRHWPGPLTLVLPLRRGAKLPATAGKRDAAVRVPQSAWARAIAAACGGLATSTSANLSGDAAIYDPAVLRRAFGVAGRKPDLFLDAGRLPVRAASTIVRVARGTVQTLRQGSVVIDT